MRSKWALLITLFGVLGAGQAWGELGEWNPDLPGAKAQAQSNGRPLLVFVGNLVTCSYCKAAEAGVFVKQEWKDYARAKGVPQYYADGAVAAARGVNAALTHDYGVVYWPTALIFRIKDTADLTTTDLDQATNVELIGQFIYRQGRTINGILVTAPTPANFIRVLESYYPPGSDWSADLGGSPTDTTPDAFTFTDQAGVARGTPCTSNTITVTGLDDAAPISVTGNSGTYRINSGSWTSASGSVNNGDLVTVRQTSSSSYATKTDTTLTIGGVTDTFSVTTQAQSALSCVGTLFEAEGKSGVRAVRGTFTLAASAAGRLLVKLALRTKTYSYTIAKWTAVDEDGTQWAEFTDTRSGAYLEFSVDAAGHGTGSFAAAEGTFELEMEQVQWGSSTPASEYAGYYTVSMPVSDAKAAGAESKTTGDYMPAGGGYLVFTVTAAGKVTYSGKVADGTRFSGSTVLVETVDDEGAIVGAFTVFVPLYSKGGYLAGQLAVVPLTDRLEGSAPVAACDLSSSFGWSYPGQSVPLGKTADAFTVTLEPSGDAYQKGATLASLGITAAELTTLGAPSDAAYAYMVNRVKDYAYPVAEPFPLDMGLAVVGGRLTAPAATLPVRQGDGSYLYEGSNDSGLKVTYSAATGVFSGSFKVYYDYQIPPWQHKTVTVAFEGVLTPRQGKSCTALHLAHGFFLVSDSNATAGYSFKRSYPVWLDAVE